MRELLVLVCLAGFCALSGSAALGILYGGRTAGFGLGDRIIVGMTTVVGLAEAAHLAAVLAARPFTDAVRLFGLAGLLWGLAAAVICSRMRTKERGDSARPGGSGREVTPLLAAAALVFGLLALWQAITVASGRHIYLAGDMTVETVESFLETDGIYQADPLTGQAYEAGVPLRIRILCLPTLYGILCRVSGLQAAELVWKLAPLAVLLLSYLAFWILGGVFFEGDIEKRMLFMAVTALVFCVGDSMYGMDGFGLLCCGYRGVAIRGGILLPYTFGLALRGRWRAIVCCVLAEACIVWTLYGLGACLLAALGMGAVCALRGRRGGRPRQERKGA